MTRALALAAGGLGRVAPNPSVGCVIVQRGVAISEARTADGGRPHAEEIALDLAGDAARGATAYVTLEPCAKRSSGAVSCSDRFIAAGLARVVIACADPHPNAAGAGVKRLAAAGIAVEIGLRAAEAQSLNVGFFSVVERGRPWIAIDPDPTTYDTTWTVDSSADLQRAAREAAAKGLTRVRVEPGSALLERLRVAGLIDAAND